VGLGGLALLATCGLGSYFLLADEWQGRSMRTSDIAGASAPSRDISSRAVDPAPLTTEEVFPDQTLVIAAGEQPYQVLKSQAGNNCRSAVTAGIGDLLNQAGCSQFVRGTLRAPDGSYLLTGGIFNMADAAGADRVRQQVKPMVNGGTQRFLGMSAGKGTESVALASLQAGWHVRGHFLVYCVIAATDGQPISSADPYAQRILFEIIEQYLRGSVLQRRATAPAGRSDVTDPRSPVAGG
jgi:hypothetical protein